MGKRSKAREAALKILYQLDITRDTAEDGLKIYFRHHHVAVDSKAFVSTLVEGTTQRVTEIDGILSKHATNWALDRMAIVDRNVLRLGVFELMFGGETPPKVVINEAVELAKREITVNCVAPGLIDTEMLPAEVVEEAMKIVPLRRLGRPEEVAALVAFLMTPDAAYITRQVISVNGGMMG